MNQEDLAPLEFFKGLASTDVELLGRFFESSTYVAGTVIFDQGDLAEHMYIVRDGEISIRYKPDDGPIMTVTRVQPGGVFGWSAAVGNPNYTSAAICSMDSVVLSIRGQDIVDLCSRNHRIGNVLLDRISLVIADRRRQQRSYNIPTRSQDGKNQIDEDSGN